MERVSYIGHVEVWGVLVLGCLVGLHASIQQIHLQKCLQVSININSNVNPEVYSDVISTGSKIGCVRNFIRRLSEGSSLTAVTWHVSATRAATCRMWNWPSLSDVNMTSAGDGSVTSVYLRKDIVEALGGCFGPSQMIIQLVEVRLSWHAARQHCITAGGYLVEIPTAEKHAAVVGYLNTTNIVGQIGIWIGGQAVAGNLTWDHSGAAVDAGLQLWNNNQPSQNPNETYMVMRFEKGTPVTWFTLDSILTREFICEIPSV